MNLHISFHTIITLAYTIPNIYLFLRIWQLFIEKGFKIWYTLIYFLLAMVYPVSNLFSEGDSGFATADPSCVRPSSGGSNTLN